MGPASREPGSRASALSSAGPSSAAWPSSGRRGSGGGRGSRSTACTTTALVGATAASTAPTSTTPRRWPCAPGAPPCRPWGWGVGAGLPGRSLSVLPSRLQVCPGHLQEDRRDLPLLPPRLQGEGEHGASGLPAGGTPTAPPAQGLWEAHSWVPPPPHPPGPLRSGAAPTLSGGSGAAAAAAATAAAAGAGAAFPLEGLGENQHFSP